MAASMNITLNSLFRNLCDKTLSYEDLILQLRRVNDTQIRNKSNFQDTIGQMHTFLHTASDRVRGLLLLSCLISRCDTQDLNQHMATWLKVITQILQSREPAVVLKLTCHVCCQLIKVSTSLLTTRKSMQNFVPQLIPLVLVASSEWKRQSIAVLNACITHYSTVCGPFKSRIEKCIHQELQSGSVTKEVVSCFCLLSCCGTSGNQKVKYTEGWSSQVSYLLNDLHSLTDQIYNDLHSLTDQIYRDLSNTGLSMADTEITESCRESDLVTLFTNLMQCLNKMLRKSFPAMVRIPVEKILEFVDKVLFVDVAKLKSRSFEDSLLSDYLILFHRDAVNIIEVLFERKLMLPHSQKVMTVLVRELTLSHSDSPFTCTKPNRMLREAVYRAIEAMMKSTRCFLETLREEDSLVQEVLTDCKPLENTLKNSLHALNVTEPSPAKKKRIVNDTSDLAKCAELLNRESSTITECALQALYWWIMVSGVKMKSKTFQKVCDFIITTTMQVYRSRCDVPFPYSDWRCRLQLLRVLQACVMTPHKEALVPVQCAVTIFKLAELDDNLQVSSFCIEAQRMCEILVHPRAPCMSAPRYVVQEKTTLSVHGREQAIAPTDNICTNQLLDNQTHISTPHPNDQLLDNQTHIPSPNNHHEDLNDGIVHTDDSDSMETEQEVEGKGRESEQHRGSPFVEVIDSDPNSSPCVEVIDSDPNSSPCVEIIESFQESPSQCRGVSKKQGIIRAESVSSKTDTGSVQEIDEDLRHSQPSAECINSPPNDDGRHDGCQPGEEHSSVLGVSSSTEGNRISATKATDNSSSTEGNRISATKATDNISSQSDELEDMLMTFTDVDPE
ncbi:proline-, glutamic acid- and leucine-rich protein 1-like isoform X2 [Ostrea edulis]|uniref:proline-, glutamic acid- and leucine-rich protein 1-like isoform X2 n=1 Tax=Ostrea edulis TaxID=37623 RepID=UPI0024AFCFE3|nr:proline-, glutamic acid- and leucine-rich protein 1-like isoform X2 [Ostrea edulis]